MSVGVRRMINYSGLATAKGPVTMSTSPLWSPYGPYTMQQGLGAVDFQGFYGEADGAQQGQANLFDQAKQLVNKAIDYKIMGYPAWMVLGGAYLANQMWQTYRMTGSLRNMPLRPNFWAAMSNEKGVAQNMAKLRWAYATGNEDEIRRLQDFFAKKAKMGVKNWRARRQGLLSYGPYGSARKAKPQGLIETIVSTLLPAPTAQTIIEDKKKKPSGKRKPAARKPAARKKPRLTSSDRSLKGMRKRALALAGKYQKQGLSKKAAAKKGWLIAKDEYDYASKRGNPLRRRKTRRTRR